jgi:hypothetical protein
MCGGSLPAHQSASMVPPTNCMLFGVVDGGGPKQVSVLRTSGARAGPVHRSRPRSGGRLCRDGCRQSARQSTRPDGARCRSAPGAVPDHSDQLPSGAPASRAANRRALSGVCPGLAGPSAPGDRAIPAVRQFLDCIRHARLAEAGLVRRLRPLHARTSWARFDRNRIVTKAPIRRLFHPCPEVCRERE